VLNLTDPIGKQVVQEGNQNYNNLNQNIQHGIDRNLARKLTERLCQEFNQRYNNSGGNLLINVTDPKVKHVVQEGNQNHIDFDQNIQQGYNPGLDTQRLFQQINQRYNNSGNNLTNVAPFNDLNNLLYCKEILDYKMKYGVDLLNRAPQSGISQNNNLGRLNQHTNFGFGPSVSTLYYPHNYGQMRHHTMLHAQQNHNTNYPNHANVRQVRPNVRESVVVQPTANQNSNKKRVRFSEDTSIGKKRKGENSNKEMILDFENNSVNNNNSNNSLDNQQNEVEDSTNISEPTEENP
uniref:Uncharacterized protein n=1 Tax=Meloidogyne floridensis TaxID=298350 RepID=A0A915NPJ3_9BILA